MSCNGIDDIRGGGSLSAPGWAVVLEIDDDLLVVAVFEARLG
jgi:hypothetical protein